MGFGVLACPSLIPASVGSAGFKSGGGTSLVIQWLRIHLAMQEMHVQSLVGELRSHMQWNNEAWAPQPSSKAAK